MNKNLLLSSLAILLLFSSCRMETDTVRSSTRIENQLATKPFKFFLQSEESEFREKINSKNFTTGNYYALGFEKLYKDYYKLNESIEKLYADNTYIDFRFHSQSIEYENGDKGMIFPVIKDNNVAGCNSAPSIHDKSPFAVP